MEKYTAEQKMEQWMRAMRFSHNGECDIDGLLAGEYGEEMKKLSLLRFRFEEDPAGEECLSYYRELGVRKEMFETDRFYARWALFTPLDMRGDRKYPVVFWNHGGGNPIETDEFSTHLTQMAGTEGFIACMLQNTNWENLGRVLDIILEKYPADPERIYIMGYSQGGQAAHSALLRIPGRLAAVSACGCDAFPLWDNMDVRFTLEEVDRLRDIFVPVIQIAGRYEFLNLLPHNLWRDRKLWEGPPMPLNLYRHPDHDLAADPTNPAGKRADPPMPPPNTDGDWWKVAKLNLRLASLGCEPVDPARCISYQNTPEDELHHVLGFYGDREEIRTYHGIRHFIADKRNAGGMTAYRYVAVDKNPHWPLLMMAELSWEFFKNYRRDTGTGRIAADPYQNG